MFWFFLAGEFICTAMIGGLVGEVAKRIDDELGIYPFIWPASWALSWWIGYEWGTRAGDATFRYLMRKR